MKAKNRRKTPDTAPVTTPGTTRDSLLRSICGRVASLALLDTLKSLGERIFKSALD